MMTATISFEVTAYCRACGKQLEADCGPLERSYYNPIVDRGQLIVNVDPCSDCSQKQIVEEAETP